jgi:hypothetical protein
VVEDPWPKIHLGRRSIWSKIENIEHRPCDGRGAVIHHTDYRLSASQAEARGHASAIDGYENPRRGTDSLDRDTLGVIRCFQIFKERDVIGAFELSLFGRFSAGIGRYVLAKFVKRRFAGFVLRKRIAIGVSLLADFTVGVI